MLKTTALATVFAFTLGGAAFAQGNSVDAGNNDVNIDAGGGEGLVVVDIANVANDIANNLSVDLDDLADVGSVQVPISVAAAVCELEVNAIASTNDKGKKSCSAKSTNEALTQAVQQNLNTQNK